MPPKSPENPNGRYPEHTSKPLPSPIIKDESTTHIHLIAIVSLKAVAVMKGIARPISFGPVSKAYSTLNHRAPRPRFEGRRRSRSRGARVYGRGGCDGDGFGCAGRAAG